MQVADRRRDGAHARFDFVLDLRRDRLASS